MKVRSIAWVLPLLAGVFVLLFIFPPVLIRIGTFLASAADTDIASADAIVPLGGSSPFRAMEAAALFHQGFAPRVLVPRPVEGPYTREMKALGLIVGGPQDKVFYALKRLRVPAQAVTLLPDIAGNTEEELESIGRHALALGYQRLIIVTSWYHARRVRLIWKIRVSAGPTAEVRTLSPERASMEGVDPREWWRSEFGRELVVHEYLGILKLVLRYPLAFIRA